MPMYFTDTISAVRGYDNNFSNDCSTRAESFFVKVWDDINSADTENSNINVGFTEREK